MLLTTWAINRFKCSKEGRGISRFRRQISYTASLSTKKVQSEFSIVEWVERTALYGSTTAVETRGPGYTANSSLDFLP
jgi:hypothetical protein